jgi:hypothetical protein
VSARLLFLPPYSPDDERIVEGIWTRIRDLQCGAREINVDSRVTAHPLRIAFAFC